jgi:hypothetical protein
MSINVFTLASLLVNDNTKHQYYTFMIMVAVQGKIMLLDADFPVDGAPMASLVFHALRTLYISLIQLIVGTLIRSDIKNSVKSLHVFFALLLFYSTSIEYMLAFTCFHVYSLHY